MTIPAADMGAWTSSSITTIKGIVAEGLMPGDNFQIFGSITGTEAAAMDGVWVGYAELVQGQSPYVGPIPMYWSAYPFYRMVQASGTTPGASVLLDGT